jgi:predicted DNA-binding protein
MVKQPTPVRIKAELLEQLKNYSARTGVPVTRCIDEAVIDWLRNVAPARLRALELPVSGGMKGQVGK